MKRPLVSIALCTYNGERFIGEQLDSFASQTCQPDELVVCDDASTDGTPSLVQRFANSAPFRVRLSINESNLGVRKNFDRAIGLCEGEVIFLSDQDDVWRPQKLARFVDTFTRHPNVGLVFTDADVVDESLAPKGYRVWSNFEFSNRDQAEVAAGRGFAVLLRHTFVGGATLAFRSNHRSMLLPIPDTWAFDAWVSLMVSAVSDTAMVTEPMNLYRQHATQVMGGPRKGPLRRYLEAKRAVDAGFFEQAAQQYQTSRSRLIDFGAGLQNPGVIKAFDERIQMCHTRARMRHNALLRWPLVITNLLRGRYHRFGRGWKTAGLDLIV